MEKRPRVDENMEEQLEALKIDGENETYRHCAYCLIRVPAKDVKFCGGCEKRAYCSEECRSSDWSLENSGAQGHKNWCKLNCGEEDVDWEVAPVPGKGLGLIAKRLFAPLTRIMVDAMRPRYHPGVKDLMPSGGSIQAKFALNALGDTRDYKDVIFLRIARANHNCDHNASHYFDDTFKVKVLFSEREIKEGEEICITYQAFNDIGDTQTAKSTRAVLQKKWRIICPRNCICRDVAYNKIVEDGRELDSFVLSVALTGLPELAVTTVNLLMDKHALLRSSFVSKWRTLYDGYQVASMNTKFDHLADGFVRQAYDMMSSILSPESGACLRVKRLFNKDKNTEQESEESKQEAEEEEPKVKIDDKKDIRHCAFCLIEVPSRDIKVCGGCKKRAYCSKDCQVADWSLKKSGAQGHKNWCNLDCGEEDVDWEVAPVPGKGLGLIAKRLIPPKTRIMVDARRPKSHPGVENLMPLRGTIQEKFLLNALDCATHDGEAVIFLRLARANHNCDNNANHLFDETFKVKVLFSEREIKEGEEICINYQPFNDISKFRPALSARLVLSKKWGIFCPTNCICRDEKLIEVVAESKDLDGAIARLVSQGRADQALRAVTKLMDNHTIMRSSFISKWRTSYDGFQIASTNKKARLADGFVRLAYDIISSILSPQSEKCLQLKNRF